MIFIPAVSGVLALVVAWLFLSDVSKKDKGTEEMVQISDSIKEGAIAFMKREYKTVSIFVIIVFILLSATPLFIKGKSEVNVKTAIAFALGTVFSGAAGYIGMRPPPRRTREPRTRRKKGCPKHWTSPSPAEP